MINGVTQLLMMKADVLGYFDKIKVCVGYKLISGEVIDQLSFEMMHQEVEPVYKEFDSWNIFDTIPASMDELPYELKKYVRYIEQEVGVPITVVSVGPDRTETVT
jgi:adenylosuccinate synthase